MKRILAALAALLIASSSFARVAIVVDRSTAVFTQSAGDKYRGSQTLVYQLAYQIATSFIGKFNPGSYDTFMADQITTGQAQTGLIAGTQYSAVIWCGTDGPTAANATHRTTCRSCELTKSATAPRVPQLFIGGIAENEVGFPVQSAQCSTGVSSSGFDPGNQGPDYHDNRMHLIGSTKGWPTLPSMAPSIFIRDTSTPQGAGNGTFRFLLGTDNSNMYNAVGTGLRSPKPAWRDSISNWNGRNPWYGSGSGYLIDTTGASQGMVVWIRYMDHVAGAKPIVFCHIGAHHTTPIGGGFLTTGEDTRIQPDPVPIYVSIAWLDSLLSGSVLGTRIEPAKLAVQVSGGFRRGNKSSAGGFAPYDTNSVKAALDSVATLGVPITVGVNIDSVTTYASDLAIWKRVPGAKFTLESWTGVSDSTKAGAFGWATTTSAPFLATIDPFGRFRERVYYGPYEGNFGDSSMYALLRSGKSRLASFLGGGDNIDRILIAADDDYSPLGSTKWRNVFEDSLAYILPLAGWGGVSQNADDSLNATNATNPRGWRSEQRFINFGSGPVAFLSHPGFNPRGSTYANGSQLISDGSASDSSWAISHTKRSLLGLFCSMWETPQRYDWLKATSISGLPVNDHWWSEPGTHAEISPLSNIRTGVNLVRVTASGFGSGSSTSSPDMPAFYTLKYLAYQVDAINTAAGRKLIVFTYPGSLGPKDIIR